MPPACAACLLFALILRSIVRFVDRCAELSFLTFWLTERETGLFGQPIHTSTPSQMELNFASLHTYKLWQTCDMRIITAASPSLAQPSIDLSCVLYCDREAANSIADNAICIN